MTNNCDLFKHMSDTHATFLECDGCGKIHNETPDFVMCDCGRVAMRMEWAGPGKIITHLQNENARLQAAINGFAEQYREVKAWHDAPLIKRLFDLANDQGHLSQPGADAATKKDSE